MNETEIHYSMLALTGYPHTRTHILLGDCLTKHQTVGICVFFLPVHKTPLRRRKQNAYSLTHRKSFGCDKTQNSALSTLWLHSYGGLSEGGRANDKLSSTLTPFIPL